MEEEQIKIIVDVIRNEVIDYQGQFNPEGLCIFFANNISEMLTEAEIEHYTLTISNFVDTDYHHEFIIAQAVNKTFLIDPSYGQFANNGSKLIKFASWPVDVLKTKENGNIIANQLIDEGLCQVSEADVKNYLASFDIAKKAEDIDFSFDKLKENNIYK